MDEQREKTCVLSPKSFTEEKGNKTTKTGMKQTFPQKSDKNVGKSTVLVW